MGGRVKVSGVTELLVTLQNIEQRATKAGFEALKEAAEKVQDFAKRGAPREFGPLEESITLEVTGGERDARGRFTRREIVVFVDENYPAPERPGGVVGVYAVRMHEGEYGLGLLSLQKQMADPEVEVGPKFLERAADRVAGEVETKVAGRVRSAIE
jgi:hypothetical protein